MAKSFAAVILVALGLTTPFGAAAKPTPGSHRAGFQSHHQNVQPHRLDRFRRSYPYFGYAAPVPNNELDDIEQAPLRTFDAPPAHHHRLDCVRSQEALKVPSEDGGIRTIVVTRC